MAKVSLGSVLLDGLCLCGMDLDEVALQSVEESRFKRVCYYEDADGGFNGVIKSAVV